MGLISTATDDNKVIDQALTVSYSKIPVNGVWSASTGLTVNTWTCAFECHRYAAVKYRYVGMDYDSAIRYADIIRNQYIRNFWISEWQSGGSHSGTFQTLRCGTKLQGTVEVVKTVGHMYEIQVDISEDDVKMSLTGTDSFDVLFANENLRSYDY